MASKTWWGREFLAALERIMDAGRLRRGRSYSRGRRLVAFDIDLGQVTAEMEGNVNPYFGVYETPYYDVSIGLKRVTRFHWKRILAELGSNADWVTHLVLGEVPPTIEDAFAGANVGLLPRSRSEIKSTCSCPDWANPCKHVAGAYYRVAAMLDRDPLILFELRGMDRETLLKALAKTEFGAALKDEANAREPDIEAALQTPRFPAVESAAPVSPASDLRSFWRGRPLPADPAEATSEPPIPALLLSREGDYPAFWNRENSFLDAMTDIYERVAKNLPAAVSWDRGRGR